MTKWDYDDVRILYKRAENAEQRAEKAEVAEATLKARIATLNSRIYPGDPDLIPNLERKRDEAAAEVKRKQCAMDRALIALQDGVTGECNICFKSDNPGCSACTAIMHLDGAEGGRNDQID